MVGYPETIQIVGVTSRFYQLRPWQGVLSVMAG